MKTKLSKIQIIDETVEFYTNNPRSLVPLGRNVCLYQGPNGAVCAFARVVKPECRGKLREGKTVSTLVDAGLVKDSDLIEQYQGHSWGFWLDIQALHDVPSNWFKRQLTYNGLKAVQMLKERYADELSTKQQ